MNPLEWVSSFPAEWAVFFLSMLPLTELRAAIPIGLKVYNLPVLTTWIFAVLGNALPTVFILFFMPRLHDWFIKQKFFGNVVKKKLLKAEKAFSGNFAKYGAIALILFVGIPLPMTGAWTGSLAAFIFKIPFKKAFPLIFAGICVAATFVTALTLFAGGAFNSIR